jgi:hypothetical protein
MSMPNELSASTAESMLAHQRTRFIDIVRTTLAVVAAVVALYAGQAE